MTGNDQKNVLLAAAQPLIELAVAEDIGPGDATSLATLPAGSVLCGRIAAKSAGVVAGLAVAEAVFHRVDPALTFAAEAADGQEVVPGERVATVTGPARSLLAAERTALNFLQRLSGIATLTRAYVDAVAGSDAIILDTRKTIPGFRDLDKYAVRMGGGRNHRRSLHDMLLVKDNHVDGAGGIVPAVTRARAGYPDLPLEVEVRSLEELREALGIDPPVDRIMLDNFPLERMRQAVELTAGRVPLEVSGNVTLERAAAIAATGVDCISVGALTHSAPALDLNMKIVRPGVATPEEEAGPAITAAKAQLGRRLVILGHHYQRDEVLATTDFRGDSLQLARDAARAEAEFIVFCGVHFMAETAACLARPGQQVLTPDPTAGCFLADTADAAAVAAAWDSLSAVLGPAGAEFTPVIYVNSSVALKAFVGRNGGITCTSSNAEAVLRWALARRPRVLFLPDRHLGRNMGKRAGLATEEIVGWDPARPAAPGILSRARMVVWPGCCNIHQRFRPEHVREIRERFPGIRVLVHPECPPEVVELADGAGSTTHIIGQVAAATAGSLWAIGTETRLVDRLARENPAQRVVSLAPVPPFCRTMAQITAGKLARLLADLAGGRTTNRVEVDPGLAGDARLAIQRMLDL